MLDLHILTTKGFYHPGEIISLKVICHSSQDVEGFLRIDFTEMGVIKGGFEKEIDVYAGGNQWLLKIPPINDQPGSYGIRASLRQRKAHELAVAYSAVDTLNDWTDFPRYGFMTDFSPDRNNNNVALDALAAYHINGLQFYDWQYRHDTLFPPKTVYQDPLGRELSIETVQKLVIDAHDHGMAALPYLAVYAASLSFWREHPEWHMMDAEGDPYTFEDFLGLMNPSPDSPWIDHLVEQCAQILEAIPFDGLHVDQYGEPRIAYGASGNLIDLPWAFQSFISRLKQTFQKRAVVFNAVANWPIDALADSEADFLYIEIWPPDTGFDDLRRILLDARKKSGGKPVVIALYLDAAWEVNIRLANAIIMSLGGSRIELGEDGRLLSDPYFPKHQERTPELADAMQRYQDFLVRYGKILGPTAKQVDLEEVQVTGGVMMTACRNGDWLGVSLVNFAGLDAPCWNEAQLIPTEHQDMRIRFSVAHAPDAVWAASPDGQSPEMQPLPFRYERGKLDIQLPHLAYWSLLLLHFNHEEI